MGRGSDELHAAAAPYVCVRIVDMAGVDLNLIRFDFDLTFAAVVMHPDGTIYHRYGSRGPGAPGDYLSLSSLAMLLRDTVREHTLYDRAGRPPQARTPLPAIELPVLQEKRRQGQKIDCVHCHTVHDAEHVDLVRQDRWRQDDLWIYPDPARLGLTLDRERQALVTAVAPGSPAATAGLRPGDELRALGEQTSVRTQSDVQWALHRAPSGAATLPVRWQRGDRDDAGTIALAAGWKRCPPEDYAWRPFKWNLSPSCGFGGPALAAAERSRLGIADGTFAFRVGYIVDWGERAHRGRAAQQAGLKKGDVVVAFAGKHDFTSVEHFHAWVALTQQAGTDTEIVVLRGGKRVVLRYALPE